MSDFPLVPNSLLVVGSPSGSNEVPWWNGGGTAFTGSPQLSGIVTAQGFATDGTGDVNIEPPGADLPSALLTIKALSGATPQNWALQVTPGSEGILDFLYNNVSALTLEPPSSDAIRLLGGTGSTLIIDSAQDTVGSPAIRLRALTNYAAGQYPFIFSDGGGDLAKIGGDGALQLTGKITSYNAETTAGNGVPVIIASGQDVASSGAGAQNTAVASVTPTATGQFFVGVMVSTTSDDTVTVTVTWTDPTNNAAQTRTVISAVAVGANAQTNGSVFFRGKAGSPISVQITVSSQTATKASASIQRWT